MRNWQTVIGSFLCSYIICISVSIAEDKVFIREYTYQASEIDSKISCRTNAVQQVKRILLDELGTYLESHTEILNLKVTKDNINIYTAGITQVKILNEKWDGEIYWLKAELVADPERVIDHIKKIKVEHDRQAELIETQKKIEKILSENIRLKKKIKNIESGYQNFNQDNLLYNNNINKIRAIEIYKEANAMFYNNNYSKCISLLKKALELYPSYANSIALLSRAYRVVGDNKLTKSFAKKALKLDYDKEDPYMYELRGVSYIALRKYRSAEKEFNKAIALNPNSCGAIRLKGLCLSLTGRYKLGIKHINTAIAKCPDDYSTYVTRGIAYYNKKKYEEAIRDYEKSIEINPESGYTYYRLSIAYKKKGNKKNYIRYCKISCDLNYIPACKACEK